MESAPNEVANLPPLQRIELSPNSNTTTTNSSNNGLQQTLEKLLLRISSMETSIYDLQRKKVQTHPEALPSRSDTVRGQDNLFLHAPVDQELSGGDLNPPAEELESCNSENRHAANQVSSGYIIKETANQSVVVALFNRIQPYEKAPSRKRSTSTTSGSGTSGSKNRKLSEKANTQGGGLDVGNEVIDEIVCKKVAPQACGHLYWRTWPKLVLNFGSLSQKMT